MKSILLAAGALAALGLAACSKSDNAPVPAHNDVAAAMPDAASTPGAQGPATAAPHGTPPDVSTLSDRHPQPGAPAGNATAPSAGNTTP